MAIRKFIVRKLINNWLKNVPKNNIQGMMNEAKILLWKDGECHVGFKLGKEHLNTCGILHSGMAILLADVTCALAVFSHTKVIARFIYYPFRSLVPPSTVNLNFSFLNTALPDDEILIKAGVRNIKIDPASIETNSLDPVDGPLASLDISLWNEKTNTLLVRGDMLMHVEALATAN